MNPTTPNLDRLAELSARYARYSLSAGGLSSVFGAVMLFTVFVIQAYVDLEPAHRIALAATPLLWLGVKEALRRGYYQRDGVATQIPSRKERRAHGWQAVYLGAMAALINGFVIVLAVRGGHLWSLPTLGYVTMVTALPLVAWRWFWSTSDFLVGVGLFCQAAVVLSGSQYPPIWLLYMGPVALLVVAYGWREHRDYLSLRRELASGAPR